MSSPPNLPNGLTSAEWAKMSEEEKKPYKDEYLKALDEYYKQKEEYKMTDQSKAYQKFKLEKRRSARKMLGDMAHETEPKTSKDNPALPGDIKIFTKEFLDYNKEQEKKLKTIRMQNNDTEQECHRINANIELMGAEIRRTRIDNLRKSNRIEEIDDALSTWHKTILEALGKAKLLDQMKLNAKESLVEDLANKLEEIAGNKNMAENSRLQQSIKQALSNVRLQIV